MKVKVLTEIKFNDSASSSKQCSFHFNFIMMHVELFSRSTGLFRKKIQIVFSKKNSWINISVHSFSTVPNHQFNANKQWIIFMEYQTKLNINISTMHSWKNLVYNHCRLSELKHSCWTFKNVLLLLRLHICMDISSCKFKILTPL